MNAFRRFMLWILIPSGFQLVETARHPKIVLDFKKGTDGVYGQNS